MTEQPQDPQLGDEPTPQPAATTGTVTSEDGLVFDAPADVPEDLAKGHKVYDRTLGRYVGPMLDKKPSASDVKKAVAKGHKAAAVRV